MAPGQRGRLIIVGGLPGAGKTTLARRLEGELGAVRLGPDEWLADLGLDLFDSDARTRVERLQWGLARRILTLGGTAVLDWGTWSHAGRTALRLQAHELGAAVELRFLDAPLDVLWARVQQRDHGRRPGRTLTRAELERWAQTVERPDAAELARFDPPAPAGLVAEPPRPDRGAPGPPR